MAYRLFSALVTPESLFGDIILLLSVLLQKNVYLLHVISQVFSFIGLEKIF